MFQSFSLEYSPFQTPEVSEEYTTSLALSMSLRRWSSRKKWICFPKSTAMESSTRRCPVGAAALVDGPVLVPQGSTREGGESSTRRENDGQMDMFIWAHPMLPS